MAFSSEDREELIQILNMVLDSRDRIDQERHRADHDFVELLRERYQRHQDLWKKFQTSLVGGLALAVLGALGWVGSIILHHLR